ncbi:TrmB family transcriptional regulator [Methanocella conradii]|uniref:TrmB family transcriptional regulator n=1 Tax=Methanocella conradii TaxID=1175444 RepID=UPI00157CF379|nr:helix-turn-helix domain-containing protein [Methanocella conradii]
MSDRWMVEALKRLGLTEYEARAYMALNLIKVGTVSDIHMASGIPRSAIYGALSRLEERGLIEVEKGKPMRYRGIAPVKAIEKLRSAIEEESEKALKHLEEAHARGESQEHAESVWTIRGVKNLYNKVSDMVSDAKRSIVFIATDPLFLDFRERYPIFENIMPMLKKRIAAWVHVRLVYTTRSTADYALRELPGIEVRLMDPEKPSSRIPLMGCVLMVDDAEVLISIMGDTIPGGNEITAIHTRMESIISVLRHFIEVEWDAALPLKHASSHE